MRIAVIGAGAMGSIYGGHLSQNNEVYLVDTAAPVVEHIRKEGLKIQENGQDVIYRPQAMTSTEGLEPVDLVILFVKSLFSRAALSGNKSLIGPDTYVMTLQNGSGHEDILGEFVDQDHIVIGTTEDNGAVLGLGHIRRGGEGNTNVGMLVEDKDGFLPKLKEAFDCCGFNVKIHANIQQLIWDKLFTNVSLSAVTGILQVDMGYIASNEYAWAMTRRLIKEAVAVAKAMGLEADEEAIAAKVRKTSEMSPNGCTSIRADLRDGRKSEVDTISGSVVRAAAKVGVPVPSHEFVVNMVHALEGKNA
ncbi:ketopantoate reductase family protein [Clostridiales bacterium TF09-2AC]|uniref:2-dehydropantoate 2-reductase n=1 Tax=Enterocloster hominis (ex Hitch et al. 2024) TaxID=1917870 RepID=A0ABV1D3B0_9FIRM|nr:ketopantoate reductase family protein [Lachnoclostridium pacaense]EEQ58417.1 2-dehydropantoate 2-reductase [Clostridiales bacterium 1_7_47FAA]MCC2817751.1 ketopantoate reductase family protein [Lachnoclostridium pacaense]RJW54125.1 ketopantoate reductase family protein [Clostridiales bacterium TF09-2AC]